MTEWKAGDVVPAERVNELPVGTAVVIQWDHEDEITSDSALVKVGPGDWAGPTDPADPADDQIVTDVYRGPGGAVYHVLYVGSAA
ncbi:hypothetical protein [Pseudonocardia sp. NPDC049154]|uniref:hypothetical protein n=1 Tax=Pseudonocardia sp. NPDC049154 TaxID=3155501 RepID=UPI0033D9C3FD